MTLSSGASVANGRLDPDLIVALAGAAVGDRVATGLARVIDRELGDQRPAERGEQRIAEAVDRVRLDRRQRRSRARTPPARRRREASTAPSWQRLALDDVVVLARLAEVDGQRDDLGLVLVLDPLEHHARVEPAAVEQQHAVDFVGVGLVGGGSDLVQLAFASEGYSHRAPQRRPVQNRRLGAAQLRVERSRSFSSHHSASIGDRGEAAGANTATGSRSSPIRSTSSDVGDRRRRASSTGESPASAPSPSR